MNTTGIVETKPTILIADDDASTRMLLRATISQWDYPVLEASDGEEAWEILMGDNSPQIVTVDWMMPKIDGLSLCRLAKNLPKPPYMILLTSMTGSANVVNALDSGADDFLSKPFNYAELRSRLFVGERIVNFNNKLEAVIKKQMPDYEKLTKELSDAVGKLLDINLQINDEWGLLLQYIQNIGDLQLEDQIALKKISHDTYTCQLQLTHELKNLSRLVDKRQYYNFKSKDFHHKK